MSSNNPLKTVESPEKQREESPGEPPEPRRNVDPARVEELEDQVAALEEQLAGVEGDGEDAEEEKPEPDYKCSGEDCEGFAAEEPEPEHVTTRKDDGDRPKKVECPRCGEKHQVKKIVPKKEQRAMLGLPVVKSNDKAAGKKVREDFENAGRKDVLEEAEGE
jgi:hypothetical protein